MSRQKQGLAIVALYDFFRLFEASQVENPVPAIEQIEMLFKLLNLKGRDLIDGAEPLAQQLSKHGQCSGRRPELRWLQALHLEYGRPGQESQAELS